MSAAAEDRENLSQAQLSRRRIQKDKRLPPSRIPVPLRPARAPLSAIQSPGGGSRVRDVPNFSKLHQKWEQKMTKKKQENREKTRHRRNDRAPSDHVIPTGHLSLPKMGRRQGLPLHFQIPPKSPYAGARGREVGEGERLKELLERMVQTTADSLRTQTRVGRKGEMEDIKLNLEELIDEETHQCSNTTLGVSRPPVFSLPSRTTVYQVEEELCTLSRSRGPAPDHAPLRPRNPVAQILEEHYFVPVGQQAAAAARLPTQRH